MPTAIQKLPELDKDWIATILEGMFSEPNKCVIALPPEARDLFDTWMENYFLPLIKTDSENEDYDSIATLSKGYFAIRVIDTPEVRDRIISEMKLKEHGIEFFIMHAPTVGQMAKRPTIALPGPKMDDLNFSLSPSS